MTDVQITPQKGHYSTDLKVKRPEMVVANAPMQVPKNNLFSNDDANKKLQDIDKDIYQGTMKEKKKHEFNTSMYFKIFGGVTLATAGIAGISRIKKFFRKS